MANWNRGSSHLVPDDLGGVRPVSSEGQTEMLGRLGWQLVPWGIISLIVTIQLHYMDTGFWFGGLTCK